MSSAVGRAVASWSASSTRARCRRSVAVGGDVGGAVRGAAVRFSTSRGSFQSRLVANARQSRSRAPTAPESSPRPARWRRPPRPGPPIDRRPARRRFAAATGRRRRRRRPTRRRRARRGTPRRASWRRRRGRPRPGAGTASASAWTNVGLALMPPSTAAARSVSPVSASAASTRSAARWATPSSTARTTCAAVGAAGDPEQRAPRSEVPVRRAEAEQRRARTRPRRRLARWPASCARRRRAMRPRSSTSHSTLVPADSMIASCPTSARRRATRRRSGTCRGRPAGARSAVRVARAEVEHPA